MGLSASSFEHVCKLVRERSAIGIGPGKEYLVESRLARIARQGNFASLDELVQHLASTPYGELHKRTVEAMTTNETSFFRDQAPFELLKQEIIPTLLAKRAAERRLHFWCAASSSGQEPYSVMMLLRENFPQVEGWGLRYLATDLSSEMVQRSREGLYSQLEVNRGLPVALLHKYFEKRGLEYQVRDDLRRAVSFRELNLVHPWPPMPSMDIVFLRNVLIYFDVAVKRQILANVRRVLRPDGYLLLGNSETTLNLDEGFEVSLGCATACYRLKGAA